MRSLIRSTITAIIRRLQRWQQARAFRAECHYNRQAIARHTWE